MNFQIKKHILDLLAGDVELRSKRELIEKCIEENLPKIKDIDSIPDEFDQYWSDQRVIALGNLCDEEHLNKEQFKSLIDAYVYNEHEPLRDEVFQCLDNRPSILRARKIGDRIIKR